MELNKQNKTSDGSKDKGTEHEYGLRYTEHESTDSGEDGTFVSKGKSPGGGDIGNPFSRKSRIARTPPQRERASSSTVMRDVTVPPMKPTHAQEELCPEKEKRKRSEDSPALESNQDKAKTSVTKKPREDPAKGKQVEVTEETKRQIKKLDRLGDLIYSTIDEIKFLRRMVNDNRNTKVEVKNSSAVLAELARKLELEDHTQNLMGVVEKLSRQERTEVAVQTELLPGQSVRSNDLRETAETATQTEKSVRREPRPQTRKDEYEKVTNACNDEEILEAAKIAWEGKWFNCATIIEGNPLNSSGDGDLAIFLQGEERTMENGIARQFRDRFPDLSKIAQEEPGVGSIKLVSTVQVGNEEPITHQRRVYKVAMRETSERELLTAVKSLKLMMEVHKTNDIAFPVPTGLEAQVVRKISELAFRDAGVRVKIHIPQKRGGRGKPQNMPTVGKQRQRREEKDTDVLLIRQGQATYGEMLKGLKNIVAENERGIAPKEVRKARDGRLLLTFDKGEQGVEELKQQIMASWKGAEVTGGNLDTKTRTLHIKGMDALVEEGDIRAAICAAMGPSQGQALEISQCRPMFGGNKAVTVKVPRDGAEELLKKGKIKIGFNACKIDERLEVVKCYKCWGFNHMARDCHGPDRKLLCISCGQEGHKAVDCKNKQRCLHCEVEGHRSGAGNCPKFKEVLASARRAAKERVLGGG